MFDPAEPLRLRALSLFHLFLPPLIVWMLVRQGYDRRALYTQTALAWVVLVLSWTLTAPEDNINWVHGLGPEGEPLLSPVFHLLLVMALLPPVAFLPTHLVLKRLFRP